MTPELLKQCMPFASVTNIAKFVGPLTEAMDHFEINTPKRQAAFLAQLAHESGSLKYVRELASGENYEGRKDLGNTEPGDGVKFKGRGLIQITGRTNYERVGSALGYDFINEPGKLELPGPATFSAGWFWFTHGLNEFADKDYFETITRRINGGLTNLDDRMKHWKNCKQALGI